MVVKLDPEVVRAFRLRSHNLTDLADAPHLPGRHHEQWFPAGGPSLRGEQGETLTLVPVIKAFQERHKVTDMVVVADAGMLSAANLNSLESAHRMHRQRAGSR